MNEAIVHNHNAMVLSTDTIYILGDLMLGPDYESGLNYIKSLNGNKVIILGNHDNNKRKELYEACGWPVYDALRLKYKGYNFYLSHYPTITSNLERESLKQCTICLYGHTHQRDNFFYDIPFIYHVGLDSHDCKPVSIDDIILDIHNKAHECLNLL